MTEILLKVTLNRIKRAHAYGLKVSAKVTTSCQSLINLQLQDQNQN